MQPLSGPLQNFPGMVLEISADGMLLAANQAFHARAGGDVAGRPLTAVFDHQSSADKFARILANPRDAAETRWELVISTADTLVSANFVVVLDTDSQHVWLVELPRDEQIGQLTDRLVRVNGELVQMQRELARDRARLAQAYAELEEKNSELTKANQALDEFAHVVSHDLKAPLRAIRQFSTWLERDLDGRLGDEGREHFGLLQNRVQLMEEMIAGILRVARAGRGQHQVESVDVAVLVRNILELIGVPPTVTVRIADDLPVLVTETVPLQQVFQNLLTNAVRHSRRDDALIEVGGGRTADGWEFRVRDNGAGIPENLHDRVWKLFHSGAPRGDIDGSGIGLAVVKRIVESRGGRVRLESAPGQGATFFFEWQDEQI